MVPHDDFVPLVREPFVLGGKEAERKALVGHGGLFWAASPELHSQLTPWASLGALGSDAWALISYTGKGL